MLLRILTKGASDNDSSDITVRDIMLPEPITVSPSTSSLEAISIMRRNRIGCIPVVDNNHLVGIITSYDFLAASAQLFQQHMTVDLTEGVG
jgi:CBS domain-containing protein